MIPLVMAGAILLAGLVFANRLLAERYGRGEEFLPAWNGWRAFRLERLDPYSDTLKERNQVMVYGRAARAGEAPLALDLPFPLLILYFPFSLISDVNWARGAFMALTELGLLALILLSLRLLDWRPRGWFLALFSVLWFTSLLSVNSILAGSPAVLVVLGIVVAMQALRDGSDELAGILLALVSFHWQAMLLLWLFVILGIYLARRWRVLAGFSMVWVILGGITFIIFMSGPGWLIPFLRALISNLRADFGLALAPTLSEWAPLPFQDYLWTVSLALVILLAVEWAGAIRSADGPRLMWVAGLSLAITPLAGFRTSLSNFAPLVFSVLCILSFMRERWRGSAYFILTAFSLILFAVPYYLQGRFRGSPLGNELIYLAFSALIVIGLYWVRWYAVRPPLTWADGVKRELRK